MIVFMYNVLKQKFLLKKDLQSIVKIALGALNSLVPVCLLQACKLLQFIE